MKSALDSQEDGVAIAAPQIGVPLRIFLVSGRILQSINKSDKLLKDLIFINPKIIKLSSKKRYLPEGCLSVRWLYGKVNRAERATIKAYDEKGNLITRGAGGILAQIFQHETDHLDGILFTDSAIDIENIPPEAQAKQNSVSRVKKENAK